MPPYPTANLPPKLTEPVDDDTVKPVEPALNEETTGEEAQPDPLEVNTFPDVPAEESPVPPLAATRVPAKVSGPVVTPPVVRPVVPTENDETPEDPPPAEDTHVVPLDVSTFPLAPGEVRPVPPLAALSVPANVIAPLVALFGVRPVEPALNVVTPPETLSARYTFTPSL